MLQYIHKQYTFSATAIDSAHRLGEGHHASGQCWRPGCKERAPGPQHVPASAPAPPLEMPSLELFLLLQEPHSSLVRQWRAATTPGVDDHVRAFLDGRTTPLFPLGRPVVQVTHGAQMKRGAAATDDM